MFFIICLLKSKVGLSSTNVKLGVRLCSVLQWRLTNQNRVHKRVMLQFLFNRGADTFLYMGHKLNKRMIRPYKCDIFSLIF